LELETKLERVEEGAGEEEGKAVGAVEMGMAGREVSGAGFGSGRARRVGLGVGDAVNSRVVGEAVFGTRGRRVTTDE
jgi:hypothetical protein